MSIDADIADELAATPDVTMDEGERHYLIQPPDENDLEPYLRATSFIDVLEDSSHLDRWRRRLLLEHFTADPSGVVQQVVDAIQHPTMSKSKALDELARQLHAEAGGDEKRDYGTEIHEALRCYVLGESYRCSRERWAAEVEADLAAIVALLDEHGISIDPAYVEVPLALHDLKVAGRTDGLTVPAPGRKRRVADLKSGSVSPVKWAMQLAIYANANHIVSNGGRTLTPMPDIDTEVGYIIQCPKGTAKATLWEVDLVKGWADARLAEVVHEVRAIKQAERITRAKPQAAPVAASRHAFICTRIDDLKAHSAEAVQALARRWPTDIPRRGQLDEGQEWAPEHLDAVEAVVVEVSSEFGVPFPEMLAEAPTPRATEPPRRPLPDEGDDAPAEDVAALQVHVAELAAPERAWLMAVAASAKHAGRPIGLKDKPSTRRWLIVRALWRLAGVEPNDDLLRQLVGAAMGEEVQEATSLGLAVGSLTLDEADLLGRMVDAIGGALTLHYLADGSFEISGDFDAVAA